LLVWLLVVSVSRCVALASLTAAAVLCGLRLALTASPFAAENRVLSFFCLLATALVFVRHHANLRRLLAGKENLLRDTPTLHGLARTLHVLAVGLWFGTVIFFLVVGLSLFATFEKEALKPAAERPLWFPLPPEYARSRPKSDRFPDPLRKEQGARAAGLAVGPLFGWYFWIQTVCALVALSTALAWSWSRYPQRLHRVRGVVLFLAVLTVAGGWVLERKVSALRGPRNDRTDEVLKSDAPGPDDVRAAEEARTTFGKWHGISLLLNFATVLLVVVAMALAAQLPVWVAPASGLPASRASAGQVEQPRSSG
jgi:hypothetical protein